MGEEENKTINMELYYGAYDGEAREAIKDEKIEGLDLTGLPIEVDVANIDQYPNEEYALLRKNGLGGSDSSCILNVNPYKSRAELIQEKARTYLTEEEKAVGDKVPVRKGRDLEPLIIEKANKYLGIETIKPKDMYVFKDYPYLKMNFDGVGKLPKGSPKKYIPIEIKVVTVYGQKHYDPNKAFYIEGEGFQAPPPNYADSEINTIETKALQYGIPPYYYTQLQNQMMALNADYGLLSVLFDKDWKFYSFYVHPDYRLWSRLITEGYKVWQEVIKLNPNKKLEGM